MNLNNYLKISLLILSSSCLFGQNDKLEQRIGIWQQKPEKQLHLSILKRINLDTNNIYFKFIKKVIIHQDKLYILDNSLCNIQVIDRNGHWLYSIGRPGQGPGDLEYPEDFCFDQAGDIYVTNRYAKRIEVFSPDGKYKKRILLKTPSLFYNLPTQGLFISGLLYICYDLSRNLVDVYDTQGNLIKTLLQRDMPLNEKKENVGNFSLLFHLQNSDDFLFFNDFSGQFCRFDKNGTIKTKFSVYNSYLAKKAVESVEWLKTRNVGAGVSKFVSWVGCANSEYVFSMPQGKEEFNYFHVFSLDGQLLYTMKLDYFKTNDCRFLGIFCDDKNIVFVTKNMDIYITNLNNFRGGIIK